MTSLLNLAALVAEERTMLRKNWGWFVGLGVLFVLLGIAGLVFVGLATLVSVLFVGWAFVIAGIAEIANAIFRKGWSGFWLDLIVGIVTVMAGLFIVVQPLVGAKVLTMFIGVMFLIGGIFRLAAGIAMKNPYAGWFLVHGFVSVILAILIIAEWPYSSLWVIGTLVSIELLFDGFRLLSFGSAVKNLPDVGGDTDRIVVTTPTTPQI
jgi:uncharacterized membrane protein HdeD (DUF308 family)